MRPAARRDVLRPSPRSTPRPTPTTAADLIDEARPGGETHQVAGGDRPRLTTQQGIPVADDQNTLRAGERGPSLLEDFHFREKIFHFDHERIPERVVHARGFGAHGFFETYESLADVTRADLFQRPGERTPVFVRFSTVAGNKGSFDLARDVRGFAVKFYTQEGNWDLVGNNIPVFFIQDAIKFPDLVHAVKQEPDRGFPQAQSAHDNFWDFISLMPEATHMVMWTMSDRAIPRSFRFMEGFGVHTFRFVNAAGESTFVKFHWKPKLGLQSVVWNEAVKINGADPDFHRRDLWDAIDAGDFPEWELGVQLFDDDFADSFDFDVLDATKIIPEELVPVRRVGRLVLDRTVDNFFAETEQVAFCTQNVVPGIDFTNDPLLQGRNFSYLDTQLKRLGGPNFTHLPVNAPKCPVAHFQQDGHMAIANPVGRVNYEPNSWAGEAGGPREDPAGGFRTLRRAGRRHQAAGPLRALRRPLQPGPPVLRQPDAGRADAHRRRLRVRAEQVRAARRSGPAWSPTCATSTRTSPDASPTACASSRCPEPSTPARRTDHRPAAVAGAEHRRQRPGELRRPQDRRARHRRHRRRAARGAAQGGRRPRARWSSSSPRRSAASSLSDGSCCRPTRRSTAARRCSTTPWPSSPRPRARPQLAADAAGEGLRHRRPRPLQVHRLHRRRRGRCSRRPASPAELDDGYIALDRRAAIATFVEPAATCATGPAPPPSTRPDRDVDIQTRHRPRPRRLDIRRSLDRHTAPGAVERRHPSALAGRASRR